MCSMCWKISNRNIAVALWEKKSSIYWFSKLRYLFYLLVYALGLCLVSRLGKHRKGGGADQSRKVLCFVDFKLRQEKTFANKLARYLTKLRNLGRLGYAVGDFGILLFLIFFFIFIRTPRGERSTCCGKETSPFCQAHNIEASFKCTCTWELCFSCSSSLDLCFDFGVGAFLELIQI